MQVVIFELRGNVHYCFGDAPVHEDDHDQNRPGQRRFVDRQKA